MRTLLFIMIVSINSLYADSSHATETSLITDKVIESKLEYLGFCDTSKNINEVKKYISEKTTSVELEEIILEHI